MKKYALAVLALTIAGYGQAAEKQVELFSVTEQGTGASVGTVTINETPYGLLFTPALHDLPAGAHGFHIHANGNCAPGVSEGKMQPAGAAGGHLDPQNSGKHLGPWQPGHAGDLPVLFVDANGTSGYAVNAPRLKSLSEITGKALMVHGGGDNYTDQPPAGGGATRLACGVIQ